MSHRSKRSLLFFLVLLITLVSPLVILTWLQVKRAQINQQLVVAVKALNVSQVRECLRVGADPNIGDRVSDPTPLWQAIINLVAHRRLGADPQVGVPLLNAVMSFQGSGFEQFINTDLRCRHAAIALLLLDYGAHPARPHPLDLHDRPLYNATLLGDTAVVNALLNRGEDANSYYGGDLPVSTLLSVAVRNDDTATALLLLQHGASPNPTFVSFMEQPLSEAILHSNEVLVRALLEKRANVTQKESDGETVLALARKYKQPSIITLLNRAGAKR